MAAKLLQIIELIFANPDFELNKFKSDLIRENYYI